MATFAGYSIFTIYSNQCEGSINIVNNTTKSLTNWNVVIQMTPITSLQFFNFNVTSLGGNIYEVTPKSWNTTLKPYSMISSGFVATYNNRRVPIVFPYIPGSGGNYLNI